MHESLGCPPCVKMDLKIKGQCWKGFNYAEDAGKPKHVQERGFFSGEQQAVELFKANKGLNDH